jgi:hypothetical protein
MSEQALAVERADTLAAIDDPVEIEKSSLQPVAADERIQLIDVLRGFALFGVLLANMVYLSGTDVALTPARAASLPTARLDGYAAPSSTSSWTTRRTRSSRSSSVSASPSR